MNYICSNIDNISKIAKYSFLGLFTLIGIIKLFKISVTSKAIGSFIKFFLIGIIFFVTIHFGAKYMNKYCTNKYSNKEETKEIKEKKEEPQEETNIPVVEPAVKEEPKMEVIDGVTYVDGILIVNKTYSLPENYRPENSDGYDRCTTCITKETKEAFNLMEADARALGLNIYISSGFRSYKYQNELYERYAAKDGYANADTYSARPGHSEHQTGLAFDLNTIDDSFANTEEGKWIYDNCYKYGFILRYPKGKEKETGYQYESWHLRYVGKELASKLYNDGNWKTLEEHFGLTSVYE